MPKYWFCLLLTVNSYYCFSQHEVHVLIKYLPAHTYTLNSDQITNINFDFTGNWDSLTSPPGTGKPIRKTVVSQTEAITNTGAFYNDSLFPVRTEITKMNTADGKTPIPVGSAIYSTFSKSGNVTIDSLSSENMEPEMKEKLLPFLKSLIQGVTIPEYTLKEGESFIFPTPLKMPVAGMTINMTINSVYTLKYASQDVAYFDIVQTYTMNSESASLPVTATGSGSGSFSYDIKNNYFTKYEIKSNIGMTFDTNGKGIKMTSETTQIQNVKIASN